MKINASQTIITNSVKNIDSFVEAVFMPYEGRNRCSRCIYSYNEKKCLCAPCNENERKDKKNGYYRAANRQKFEKTPVKNTQLGF